MIDISPCEYTAQLQHVSIPHNLLRHYQTRVEPALATVILRWKSSCHNHYTLLEKTAHCCLCQMQSKGAHVRSGKAALVTPPLIHHVWSSSKSVINKIPLQTCNNSAQKCQKKSVCIVLLLILVRKRWLHAAVACSAD
jgi:hypothetical protein